MSVLTFLSAGEDCLLLSINGFFSCVIISEFITLSSVSSFVMVAFITFSCVGVVEILLGICTEDIAGMSFLSCASAYDVPDPFSGCFVITLRTCEVFESVREGKFSSLRRNEFGRFSGHIYTFLFLRLLTTQSFVR